MVADSVIFETVKKYEDPGSIAGKLIELAVEAGGRDNVTALVISSGPENFWKKLLKTVAKI